MCRRFSPPKNVTSGEMTENAYNQADLIILAFRLSWKGCPLSEVDNCPVCGEPIKRKNLLRHYRRVHPKRSSALLQPKLQSRLSSKTRIRRLRRTILYVLIAVSVVSISVAAAEVVSTNTVRLHIHPQLAILIRGASEIVPANVGITQNLWRDNSLDKYGVNGRSPLLTTDSSGVIHVESNTVRDFTLREFLAIWGVSVDDSQVIGNPVQPGESACILSGGQAMPPTADVVFADQQRIVLEIISGSCSAIS
jgi:hypothetical protein